MSLPQSIPSTSQNGSIQPVHSPIRATKRKLEDAMQSLDDATGSTESLVGRPPPSKKAHTTRSLYSTLAKYGIKSKDSKPPVTSNAQFELSKPTPHLTRILNRAASHTRKALPFKFLSSSSAPPLPPSAEYRPSSLPNFLARLVTFKLATYANKPTAVDAVAAAKCGWVNEGKDRLVCGICGASWVLAGRDGMTRDAANALIEKQRVSLVDNHKGGCPWKTRQCDASIYQISLQSPIAMARDIKTNALALEPVLTGVEVKHPLTSTQVNSLKNTISSIPLAFTFTASDSSPPDIPTTSTPLPAEPSTTAILVSLFGWALAPLAPERPRLTSVSRAVSRIPSATPTPSRSRASSIVSFQSPSPNPRPSISISRPRPLMRLSTDKTHGNRDTSLLHCVLCQRRVGLWAFAPQHATAVGVDSAPSVRDSIASASTTSQPQRQFDLLKEHRSYCPYVVRSAVVPSLPVPAPPSTPSSGSSFNFSGNAHVRESSSVSTLNGNRDGSMEGWRAVLTVVLRYGMGQRQRTGLARNWSSSETFQIVEEEGEPIEVDGVEAMVAGVKSRGGKDLLKYVKGLLR